MKQKDKLKQKELLIFLIGVFIFIAVTINLILLFSSIKIIEQLAYIFIIFWCLIWVIFGFILN